MSSSDDSSPHSGPALTTALTRLVTTLDARSIRYAIIGGIAVTQHSRVRTTNDVDALVEVSQIGMPAFFEALQAAGFAADPRANTIELRNDGLTSIRFGDVVVDVMRPVLPLYAHVIDRASPMQISGQPVQVSSAEGLVVMKLIAFRPQDVADIKDLLATYGDRLDVDYIKAEFATVAPPEDPRWAQFEGWMREGGLKLDSEQ